MGGDRACLRAVARPRWKQLLLLTVVCGALAGAALAAATDARRTSTAVPRMLAANHLANADVAADETYGIGPARRYMAAVEALPQVASASREGGLDLEQVVNGRLDPVFDSGTATMLAPEDDRTFRTTERLLLLQGRLPRTADEIAVNPILAAAEGWHVGSRPEGLQLFGKDSHDDNGIPIVGKGIPLDLTVVGIVRSSTELLVDPDSQVPRAFGAYAFIRAHPGSTFYSLDLVHLKSPSQLTEFRNDVETTAGHFRGTIVSVISPIEGAALVGQALHPQEAVLWALYALGSLIAVGLLAQGIATEIRGASPALGVLRALGVGPRDVMRIGLLGAAIAATGAGLLAVVVAWLLSGTGPIGVARLAEPHPGRTANVAMLAAGAAVIVFVTLAMSVVPLRRAARLHSPMNPSDPPYRASPLVARVARWGGSASAVTGVRLALQRDRRPGRQNAPMAVAAVLLAVLATTSVLVFTWNLTRLAHTKELYGWNWDVAAGVNFGTIPDDEVPPITHLPSIAAATGATFGSARIGQTIVPGIGMTRLRGEPLFPTLTSGRRPVAPSEVAMGARSLRAIHAQVGDTIDATIGGRPAHLHIVGVAVFPSLGLTTFQRPSLGSGIAGLASLFPQDPASGGTYNYVVFKVHAGGLPTLVAGLDKVGCTKADCLISDARPTEIGGYAKARGLTLAAAAMLLVAVVITLSRALISAVRSRRTEIAVYKALGMTHGQIRRVVGWQAATVTAIALIVGAPLGLAAGRAAWAAFATHLGVATNAQVVPWLIGAEAAAVAIVSIAIALVSALLARRVRAVQELRAG